MNKLLKLTFATVITISGVTFAQSNVPPAHVDTSAKREADLPAEENAHLLLRHSTASATQDEKKLPEQRTDMVASPYSPPVYKIIK